MAFCIKMVVSDLPSLTFMIQNKKATLVRPHPTFRCFTLGSDLQLVIFNQYYWIFTLHASLNFFQGQCANLTRACSNILNIKSVLKFSHNWHSLTIPGVGVGGEG